MQYDARQIANWFVSRAERDGKKLSIMSLLKLVYISHGWHLEMYGTPLFGNKIEAWQYGPVIPDVYNDFRRQGVTVDGPMQSAQSDNISDEVQSLLDQVWTIYGSLSAFRLSDMTHVSGGPWELATRMGGNYAPIPNELIKSHYSDLRQKANSAANG